MLKKDKENFEFTQQREIDENFSNIAVTEKKIENLSVDVELAKKQLEASIDEIRATGDSRLRTTYSNLQSALLDLRDAQSFYKSFFRLKPQQIRIFFFLVIHNFVQTRYFDMQSLSKM